MEICPTCKKEVEKLYEHRVGVMTMGRDEPIFHTCFGCLQKIDRDFAELYEREDYDTINHKIAMREQARKQMEDYMEKQRKREQEPEYIEVVRKKNEKIRRNIQMHEEKRKKMKEPKAKRIADNLTFHNYLRGFGQNTYCPQCNADSSKLGWICCNLGIEEVRVLAQKEWKETHRKIREEIKVKWKKVEVS